MNTSALPNLTLLVSNAQRLESGLSATKKWDTSGGIIGSGSHCQWLLKDAYDQIKSEHCEVLVIDGAFCLRDLSGDTFINGTDMPVGKGGMVKLVHKDHIHIGPYDLRVVFGDDEDNTTGSLTQLFAHISPDLLADNIHNDELKDEQESEMSTEPLAALDELILDNEKESLLVSEPAAMNKEGEKYSIVPGGDLTLQTPKSTVQTDSENEMSSSMSLKRILNFGKKVIKSNKKPAQQPNIKQDKQLKRQQITHDNVSGGLQMDEQTLDLLEEEVAKSIQPEQRANSNQATTGGHLLTGPMLNGLGVQVDQTDDIERMHMLSHEMGESLQACIKGLLDLHQQAYSGHFDTLNRNLQPIEDNPLRLGLSYQETIKTLYDVEKSSVHLSAPSAIAESLRNVQAHNEAMQHATGEALNQILDAFSPQVLQRRFQNYKRSHQEKVQDTDAWAWKMYCNYYQELTSHRQKGFEKLFWEVFEQSYDKKIREKQREF
ncbi:type VI secretion system-associated FHA domain protein TagH [Vibrio sp. YMD68]|uniref:type VI secretion system-associated FHA domain protein TagH n=1 Tax=Vibrio sp. YMD68 TaxID=3042300 RepID=UPI00249A55CA|nr:type VI secretion system-associated FHA domain protein TagH [Vibrio sp. YMD68]WGW01265.1 type VI secretion system-associated FHA domain protein TagH [Vibrio sp. YMD68]